MIAEPVPFVRETATDRIMTACLPDYTGRGAHRGALVRIHIFFTAGREVRCAGPRFCRECNREAAA